MRDSGADRDEHDIGASDGNDDGAAAAECQYEIVTCLLPPASPAPEEHLVLVSHPHNIPSLRPHLHSLRREPRSKPV